MHFETGDSDDCFNNTLFVIRVKSPKKSVIKPKIIRTDESITSFLPIQSGIIKIREIHTHINHSSICLCVNKKSTILIRNIINYCNYLW